MSERRRSVFFGVLFGYASLAVSLVRNVLLVPIYLSRIPLAEYGAWLATGGALALILINDYGLSGVVTQRISASFGARQFGELGRQAGSALAIGSLIAMALSAISLVCVPLLPGLGQLTGSQSAAVVNCFMLAIASNGLGIVGGTATSVIRSLQRAVLSGAIILVSEIANVTVTLIALFHGWGLYAIAAGMLVRSLLITVGGLIGVWCVCVRILDAKLMVQYGTVRDLLGEATRFFLSAIAMKLQAQANVFFVGSILGPASAAIYSLTVRAHETVLMIISLINGSLVPSVTHLVGSGNFARFRAVLLRLLLFLAGLTALALTATVILNPAFLQLWVGNYAFAGQSVSILMAVALFTSSVGYIAYDALLAQGKFQVVSRIFFATSVLQVVLLFALLHWGIWLAPAVTLITASCWGWAFWTSVGLSIGITRREARSLAFEIGRILGISTIVAVAFIAFYPATTSWLALTGEGILCVGCLIVGYLLFSSDLRRIAHEEIGSTLRLFRAN